MKSPISIPLNSRISGPKHEPIIALVASNEPWFTEPTNSGHCRNSLFKERNLESIVIDADFHEIQTLTKVREKVLQFLEANRRF